MSPNFFSDMKKHIFLTALCAFGFLFSCNTDKPKVAVQDQEKIGAPVPVPVPVTPTPTPEPAPAAPSQSTPEFSEELIVEWHDATAASWIQGPSGTATVDGNKLQLRAANGLAPDPVDLMDLSPEQLGTAKLVAYCNRSGQNVAITLGSSMGFIQTNSVVLVVWLPGGQGLTFPTGWPQ